MKHFRFGLIFLCAACVNHEFPAFINCGVSSLSVQVASIVPAADCTSPDGVVVLSAKGGKKPYSFSKDEGVTWSADSNVQNLSSRAYTFSLRDAYGCTVQIDTIVTSTGEFPGIVIIIPDSECIENNGSIGVALNGNTEGFMYRLDNEEFSATHLFEGIAEGAHTLYVSNNNGCTTRTTVVVPRVTTGISWINDILPIMTTSCATSGCHDGVSRLDWRNYNEVLQYAQAIKSRTRDRSMPFDKTLPQDQIDKISCWVDDGALNN
jgi:hypothetical protein